jgi:hypothetical protein
MRASDPVPDVVQPEPPPQHLMTVALDFLRANGWPIPRRIDLEAVELDFEHDDVPWTCYLEARERERQVIFYSTLKDPVPRDRMSQLLEFIARANDGLAIGNFEIDLDDGALRFKTSVDVNNAELSEGLLGGLTSINVATINVYLPGVRAVAGGMSPANAIAMVENAGE